MGRSSRKCNQVKRTEEANTPEGKMKGLCSWHWFGIDFDPLREVIQEVWDEKTKFT